MEIVIFSPALLLSEDPSMKQYFMRFEYYRGIIVGGMRRERADALRALRNVVENRITQLCGI
jgi:hypothetical protein